MSLRRVRSAAVRLPRALWVCALLGVVNAACWAVITPNFWVPDEPSHAGYVQYFAETGHLPESGAIDYKNPEGPGGEQGQVYGFLPFGVTGKPDWTDSADQALRRRLDSGRESRAKPGQALTATANPPLYYVLEALPYRVFYGSSYLDRLLAMRLFSALFAGLTVLFSFLFLRELLPTRPWTWSVGGLAVAFQPLLGFMSGGINADALAYSASAAVLWLLARAFRRGLSVRTGVPIGIAMVVGLLSKPIVIGLVPGLLVAFAVLVARSRPRRPALGGAASALGLTAVLYGLSSALNASRIKGAPPAPGVSSSHAQGIDAVKGEFGFLWQAVFPRLPFMQDQFANGWPLWDVYFKGFVGRYGWNEYVFPSAWYWVALAVFLGVLGLAGRALYQHRDAVRGRRGELLSYAALCVGLLISVEIAAFNYREDTGLPFEQARYLFPVLALWGGLVAVASVGAGRRWGPPVGAFLVVLMMGQSLFSQLLTLGRFYT